MQMNGPRFGPRSGKAPREIVLLLHGVGSNGDDLIALAPHWATAVPDALFIAPHAPFPYDQEPEGFPGRQWFSLAEWFSQPVPNPALLLPGLHAAAAAVNATLDAELARLSLPPERCVLMGFSQGAMTALAAGLSRTTPPAGLMAYSGALIDVPPLWAPRRDRPPVLMVHGEVDDIVPSMLGRMAEAALRRLGLPVEAHFLPQLGHSIDETGIAAGARFLRRVLA